MTTQVEREIGGRTLKLESGRLAKQAHGAVLAQYGETVVLATVVRDEPREGIEFFPLTVDYREKTSAAGRFPGGFFKREGRPTEKEILTMRVIDRSMRPLFAEGYRDEIQVMVTVLSADPENEPDIVAAVASLAAVEISPIHFNGPVGSVRVSRVNGELVINPTYEQIEQATLSLTVSAKRGGIVMVEGGALEESEEVLLEALNLAEKEIGTVLDAIEELRAQCGQPKLEIEPPEIREDVVAAVRGFAADRMDQDCRIADKKEREEAVKVLLEETQEQLAAPEDLPDEEKEERQRQIQEAVRDLEKETLRRLIIKENYRADGRTPQDIRAITAEVEPLPRTHGSALFTRGQTQSMVTCTLGTVSDEQIVDSLIGEQSKRFMLHYNFPPFCVGEVRPIRGPSRRDIGHGALAERALSAVIPPEEQFPYTIRLVSDILESNGSSSMATVCGGSMCLMDAGVPVRAAVAGIAVGLVIENGEVRILRDILGVEDHLGDMDLKVAGTEKGITAFQMDIKMEGITRDLLARALEEAREGRLFILQRMAEAISKPRDEMRPFVPRITLMMIPVEKIGEVIGPGGKVIRNIISETGAKIDIEDDGKVIIASDNQEAAAKAQQMIEYLTADVEVGKIYEGKVVRVTDFGAFVEVLPGKEGLVHIRHLSTYRVDRVDDVVKEGDIIRVKCYEIDDLGRINLSRQAVLEEEGIVEEPPQGERRNRDRPYPRGRRDGDRRGGGRNPRGRDRDRRGGRG
jgi:polyribonucleotide nucleotidyltransferase